LRPSSPARCTRCRTPSHHRDARTPFLHGESLRHRIPSAPPNARPGLPLSPLAGQQRDWPASNATGRPAAAIGRPAKQLAGQQIRLARLRPLASVSLLRILLSSRNGLDPRSPQHLSPTSRRIV
jgi:hypothetical protein